MDHSCVPNAVAVFSGTELHVRNTLAIDTRQCTKVGLGVERLHGWCLVKHTSSCFLPSTYAGHIGLAAAKPW